MLPYLKAHETKWVARPCQNAKHVFYCFIESACNGDKNLMFNTTIIYSVWKQVRHRVDIIGRGWAGMDRITCIRDEIWFFDDQS